MGLGLGSLNPVRIVQGKGAIGEALGPAAPILAGVALGPAGFGLMGAGAAGLTVGGITALASGNLSKGLSAGLGAWGGAAISGSLASMGASSIGDAAKAETLLSGGSEAMAADNAKFAVEKAGVLDKLGAGTSYAAQNPTAALKTLGEGSAWKGAGILGAAAAPILAGNMVQTATPPPQSSGLIRPYQFNRKVVTPTDMVQPTYQQGQSTAERNWFEDSFTALPTYKAPGPEYTKAAKGGIMSLAEGGAIQSFDPVIRMADGGQAIDYGKMPRYVFDPITQTYTLLNPLPIEDMTAINTQGYTGYEGYGGGDGSVGEGTASGHDASSVGVADAGIGVGPSSSEATAAAADASTGAVGSSGEAGAAAAGAGPGGPGGGDSSSDGGSGDGSGAGGDGSGAGAGGDGGSGGGDGGGGGGGGGGDGGGGGGGDGGGGGGGGGDGGGGEAAGGLAPYFRRMYAGGMPYAGGGLPSLGGYASGGNPRLLRGPGDGMSDNIPAVIGGKQPARLADGEFVVPADVVSHLGNGSTEAGAKQLYKMMDRIRAARTGKKKQAPAVKTGKYLPA